MIRNIVFFATATVICCGGFAQNKKYYDDYESGYRGGYIKNIVRPDNSLNFIVIGDWGRKGEYFQKEVAQQLANASVSLDADFFITTGDNFYPDGVASIHDPLWKSSFEDVYTQFGLQKNWYVTIGNHDYRGSVDAQIEYSKISRRWNLPARYYSKRFWIDGDSTQQVLIAFIDTDPFIKSYYKDPNYREEMIKQDTAAQKRWLENVLSDTSSIIKWKFVVGHHQAYTGGKRKENDDTKSIRYSFTPLFEKYKVNAFIAGHEHHLEYDKPEGLTHYFISGAGSATTPAEKLSGIGKFTARDHGFISFSVTENKMIVQFINYLGKIVYRTVIVN
jgi:hypothetical protein